MEAFERLLNYSQFPTASDENSNSCPSTQSQLIFGKYLAHEMNGLGMSNVIQDENGYVYGMIKSNIDYVVPTVGFISHMDVVHEVDYTNIKPQIIKNYNGNDIVLNEQLNIVMKISDYPVLKNYIGNDLIVSDGTTLIGCDDKCGIAQIMTMAEKLLSNNDIKHGNVMIGFTPDEEIGRGADRFNIKSFNADFAYTVDGAAFGEIAYENFNAASASVNFKGFSIHPGDAKNKMKNATRIAYEFDSMIPEAQRPEFTDNYEGFFHLTDIRGTVDTATANYILRDHDINKLDEKKNILLSIKDFLNNKYGKETVSIEIKDQYKNMSSIINEHKEIIELAEKSIKEAGGIPVSKPIRGGTDGATLTYNGLPCPNLGTGSHNHHGVFEFASINSMDKGVASLINIVKNIAII